MRSLWFTVAAFGLAACSGDADKEGTGDRVDTILALTGDAAAGDALYVSSCQLCHGTNGEGIPNSGSDLRPVGDAELVETILYGVDGTAMVAFEDQFSDQDVADLTAFVLTL
jgi:mono/diheme cytochrome c family protein